MLVSTNCTSVNPSARKSSSATYWGAIQILATFPNRMVLVSGGPSCANEASAPNKPAAPADDSVAKNPRRLCMDGMIRPPIIKATMEQQARAEAPVNVAGFAVFGRFNDCAQLSLPAR